MQMDFVQRIVDLVKTEYLREEHNTKGKAEYMPTGAIKESQSQSRH